MAQLNSTTSRSLSVNNINVAGSVIFTELSVLSDNTRNIAYGRRMTVSGSSLILDLSESDANGLYIVQIATSRAVNVNNVPYFRIYSTLSNANNNSTNLIVYGHSILIYVNGPASRRYITIYANESTVNNSTAQAPLVYKIYNSDVGNAFFINAFDIAGQTTDVVYRKII